MVLRPTKGATHWPVGGAGGVWMLLSPPAPSFEEEKRMATKWTLPRFLKHRKDVLDASIAALPTSSEVNVTYVTSAYANVTVTTSS